MQYGQAHAEVNCMNSVAAEDQHLIPLSVMYVSLEPCAHYGKTPPCADLIIAKKILLVVVGCRDPFKEVDGKGIEKLKAAGIDVTLGILEKECIELNKRFFTFHTKHRPYIILKWAQTQDGFISRWPLPQYQEDNWITGKESKELVHQWRSQEQAILIGYNTLINDNPLLTTRLVNGKNPIRLVLSRTIDFPYDLRPVLILSFFRRFFYKKSAFHLRKNLRNLRINKWKML